MQINVEIDDQDFGDIQLENLGAAMEAGDIPPNFENALKLIIQDIVEEVLENERKSEKT